MPLTTATPKCYTLAQMGRGGRLFHSRQFFERVAGTIILSAPGKRRPKPLRAAAIFRVFTFASFCRALRPRDKFLPWVVGHGSPM